MNYLELIFEFYNYCGTFYDINDGIYPIAEKRVIIESCDDYLRTKKLSEIEFDSFDRECVRTIIEEKLTK